MFPVRNFYRFKIGSWVLAGMLGAAIAPVVALAQTSADATATRSSIAQGVTVKVTPSLLGSAEKRWEFTIVFDSHSADLSDDLTQSASLTTNDGRTLQPVSWTGAPAGGHHREGVLAFDVPTPPPGTIELRITRQGEIAARLFRWQL